MKPASPTQRSNRYSSEISQRLKTITSPVRVHPTICAVGLSMLLVIVATWKLTFGNRIIARGDLLLYFYPLRDYASAAIRAGVIPFWNPFTFMGAPFLANSQVGFFYPLNVIEAWIPVAQAVSWSIVAHLGIAALGTYIVARHNMRLGILASLACSVSFGLGGYLGSQVEHLNQLQVLAWLPFEIAALGGVQPRWRSIVTRAVILAFLIALQVLAGHTQSLYICMVTLVIIAIARTISIAAQHIRHDAMTRASALKSSFRLTGAILVALCVAGIVAVTMTALQLMPTIELAQQSARSGGLPFNEVGSFSWRPWVIARALLPTYGDPLFPEYVTYLGAAGLALTLLGSLAPYTQHSTDGPTNGDARPEWRIVALILALSGFVLALGIVTPLFNVLYRFLPGFNLFRAQARWLVVFAFGAALLIGLGVDSLQSNLTHRTTRHWLIAWLVTCFVLLAGLLLGARLSPETEYRSLPAPGVLIGWLTSFIVVTGLIVLIDRKGIHPQAHPSRIPAVLFSLFLCTELLVASQFQPYSRAADGQSLTDLRPSTAYLLADQILRDSHSASAGRILALSGLFFDPGDMPEQTLIYQSQLSRDELYDRIIASKEKEVLSPNLSLYYRLAGVDGYDGGLLPLRRYQEFVSPLIQSSGKSSARAPLTDGRLREALSEAPANPWLSKMAVRFLITDKTHDVFIDNVYYDLQFQQQLTGTVDLPLDEFSATALGLVLSAPQSQPGDDLLHATVYYADGEAQNFPVRASDAVTQTAFGIRLQWDGIRTPSHVVITPVVAGVTLLGMSSIDGVTGAFQTQQIQWDYHMRLVHSGDVKIYENLNPAPRVFIAPLADTNTISGELRIGDSATGDSVNAGTVTLIEDRPEKLSISAQVSRPGWLIVRDAYYPGWSARIDGSPAPIIPADSLFRAVAITPGDHQIEFTYEPQSFVTGALISIAGWLLWAAIAMAFLWRRISRRGMKP
ncbi:MAG: YfhO family protein [Chloroflexi bacterium]|nr:YfhO family protein [Chloroflexota bacterium]